MSRLNLSRRIGLVMHVLNRIAAVCASRYWGWTLGSYLRARARRCGSVRVAGFGRFANVSALEIGENVHVNAGAYWVCEGGLIIGDNVIFARNVTVYTRNHNYAGSELPFDHSNVFRPVYIGKNVWIGTNVTILPGAHINDGAIIGAGAVVAGEVPAGAIFGATKSKLIGQRDREHYARLDLERAYHRPKYFRFWR